MKKTIVFLVALVLGGYFLTSNALANIDGTYCVGCQGYVKETYSGNECGGQVCTSTTNPSGIPHPIGSHYTGSPRACSPGETGITIHHFTQNCPTCPSCTPPPTNGACDPNTARTYAVAETALTGAWCSSGTVSFPNGAVWFPSYGQSTPYWTCNGANGGSSATNCRATHLAPTPATMSYVSHSCNAAGTQAVISWSGQNATSYAVRYNYGGTPWHPDSCNQINAGDICQNMTGTNAVVYTTPGVANNLWVHAYNVAGYSTAASQTFTCNAPVVNGACNVSRAKVYAATETAWAGTGWCTSGTAVNTPLTFLTPGGSATWTCQGSGGGTSPVCNASKILPNPIVTLTANPASVNLNNGTHSITPKSTTLTWGISNIATACVGGCTCTASNAWSGNKASTGGSESSQIGSGADPTYTLTCTNAAGGTGTKSVTVTSSCTPVSWHETTCSKNCGDGVFECRNITNECQKPDNCDDLPCNLADCPVSSEWKEVTN